jgi:hypothetical protein
VAETALREEDEARERHEAGALAVLLT